MVIGLEVTWLNVDFVLEVNLNVEKDVSLTFSALAR
jgi:hypothetical protein